MNDEIRVSYGYSVIRPELACRIERGRISAYGWFLIIGGWCLTACVASVAVFAFATGLIPWQPAVIAFVMAAALVRR